MRGSVLISFLGISMAMAAAVVGCSGDDDDAVAPTPLGKEGESCTRRADCASGLLCIDQVCAKNAASSGGTGGTGGTTDNGGAPAAGGTGARPPTAGSGGSGTGGAVVAPALGGDGETCSRRADCSEGLGCYNQRCSPQPIGEGGAGNVPPPLLGGQGETCVLSADCEAGLACLPSSTAGASVGVCTPADSGIEPTGKTCSAECKAPQDCCELPTEIHGTLGVKSCFQLAEKLSGVDCSAASTADAPACFAMAVYCDCASNVWACTDGACIYRPVCTDSGLAVDGCPPFSRSGRALTTTCDVGGTDTCSLPAGTAFCDADADCIGKYVSDDATDMCSDTECTCYKNVQCLRKCADDLDCAAGKVCDDTDNVCVLRGTCLDGPEGDVTCARLLGDYRATCAGGVCTLPCGTDLDCNPTGLVNGSLTLICDTDHTCKPIGCSSDEECSNPIDVATPATARRMFCTTPPAAGVATDASSAITG